MRIKWAPRRNLRHRLGTWLPFLLIASALLLGILACTDQTPTPVPQQGQTPADDSPNLAQTQQHQLYVPALSAHQPDLAPGDTGPPPDFPKIEVEMHVSPAKIHVGDEVQVIAQISELRFPVYTLSLRGGGDSEAAELGKVTYQNQVILGNELSRWFNLVSMVGEAKQATFVLRAMEAGTISLSVATTGEVVEDYPGSPVWGIGSSDIELTILP